MSFENTESSRWFADHIQPHENALRVWLVGRVQNRHEIDDIVQEAFVRVLHAQTRANLLSPKAFLFATARNLAVDWARRRSLTHTEPLVENEALTVLDESEDIAERLSRQQELTFLTEAIQSLPDRCRQVFTLRKVYGLSQKEIAAKLGISAHTVSAQVTIGIHKCTEYVRRRRNDRWTSAP